MRKLVLATMLAAAVGACSGGGSGSGSISGYRFTMTTTMAGPGSAGFQMRGTGAVDIAANAVQLKMTTTMPSLSTAQAPSGGFGLGGVGAAFGIGGSGSAGGGETYTQEMIVAGSKAYMRLE